MTKASLAIQTGVLISHLGAPTPSLGKTRKWRRSPPGSEKLVWEGTLSVSYAVLDQPEKSPAQPLLDQLLDTSCWNVDHFSIFLLSRVELCKGIWGMQEEGLTLGFKH